MIIISAKKSKIFLALLGKNNQQFGFSRQQEQSELCADTILFLL